MVSPARASVAVTLSCSGCRPTEPRRFRCPTTKNCEPGRCDQSSASPSCRGANSRHETAEAGAAADRGALRLSRARAEAASPPFLESISVIGVYPTGWSRVRPQICPSALPHALCWIYNCGLGRPEAITARLPGEPWPSSAKRRSCCNVSSIVMVV